MFLIALVLLNGISASGFDENWERPDWSCSANTVSDGVGPIYWLSFQECKNKFKDNVVSFIYHQDSQHCQQTTHLPRVNVERMSALWTVCVDTAELGPANIVPGNWINGWCETSSGVDDNGATVNLGRGFDTDTCLKYCSKRPYTACEWNTKYRTCLRHTEQVTAANGHEQYRCYLPTPAEPKERKWDKIPDYRGSDPWGSDPWSEEGVGTSNLMKQNERLREANRALLKTLKTLSD